MLRKSKDWKRLRERDINKNDLNNNKILKIYGEIVELVANRTKSGYIYLLEIKGNTMSWMLRLGGFPTVYQRKTRPGLIYQ